MTDFGHTTTDVSDAQGLNFDSPLDAQPLDEVEPEKVPVAEEEEDSDAEAPQVGPGDQEPLPDEPWSRRPQRECALWDRLRPSGLRREAAEVKAMHLPMAAVERIVRLHPQQFRSSQALELINHSTVLMLQGVARNASRAATREKRTSKRVQFEDLRRSCLGVQELQFLHPLSGTLDASALTSRATAEADCAGAEDALNATTATRPGVKARKAQAGRPKAHPEALSRGQGVLGEGFQRHAGPAMAPASPACADEEALAGESGGEFTPERKDRPATTSATKERKRSAACLSAEKPATKAPRRSAGGKSSAVPSGGTNLSAFFRNAVEGTDLTS